MAFSSTSLLISAFLLSFLGFSASQAPMSMPPMSMASPPTATILPPMASQAPVGPPATSPTSGPSMSPPIPAAPEPGMGPASDSPPAPMGLGPSPSPMPVLATPSTPDSGASVQGCSIGLLAFLGGLALLA